MAPNGREFRWSLSLAMTIVSKVYHMIETVNGRRKNTYGNTDGLSEAAHSENEPRLAVP